MHVSLTPQLERLVREKVESGLYNNASEVVREALRLMVERDRSYLVDVESLRQAVLPAIEQAERGETVEYDRGRIIAKADKAS